MIMINHYQLLLERRAEMHFACLRRAIRPGLDTNVKEDIESWMLRHQHPAAISTVDTSSGPEPSTDHHRGLWIQWSGDQKR